MARSGVRRLRDIPNVGASMEKTLQALGMREPTDLVDQDPYALYDRLCRITRTRQDPCVLDVFIAAVRYMEGGPARKWWEYTQERKQRLASQADSRDQRNAGRADVNKLIGRKFEIAGMAIEVVADAGDRWETRNLTTGDTVYFDKAVLEGAIRLGKAEEIVDTADD